MEDQELFTELKNLFPFPSSDVSKLASTSKNAQNITNLYGKFLKNS